MNVSSSIKDHINEAGHTTSIYDFCILDNASNHLKFVIILDTPPLINRVFPYECMCFNLPGISFFFSFFSLPSSYLEIFSSFYINIDNFPKNSFLLVI